MSLYAIVKDKIVDNIAIADAPLNIDGEWICIDGVVPLPGRDWTYDGTEFHAPPPAPVVDPPPPPKTEEEKIADATAAAITKLIADGVLKPV